MDFNTAIAKTLRFEGGFQNNPADSGNWVGKRLVGTKYGIAAKFYPDLDIKNLRLKDAVEIYRRDFWAGNRIDLLPVHLRYTVFDMGVNAGISRATRGLQALSRHPSPTTKQIEYCVDIMLNIIKVDGIRGLAIDGVIGPNTAAAARGVTLEEYTRLRLAYYERVSNYASNKTFLRGWLRRARQADQFTREILSKLK